MRDLFTKSFFTIQPGHAVSGVADQAQTLRVSRGNVWVTVEGDTADYFLSAGDTFTVEPGRLLAIEVDSRDKSAGRVDLVQASRHTVAFKLGAQLISLGQRLMDTKPGAAPAQC